MIDATLSLFPATLSSLSAGGEMDFITADKRLIKASLARVDQFTKDRHIGIISAHSVILGEDRLPHIGGRRLHKVLRYFEISNQGVHAT
jgi:hypothetical protein